MDEAWQSLEDGVYPGDAEAFVDPQEVIAWGKATTAEEPVRLRGNVFSGRVVKK